MFNLNCQRDEFRWNSVKGELDSRLISLLTAYLNIVYLKKNVVQWNMYFWKYSYWQFHLIVSLCKSDRFKNMQLTFQILQSIIFWSLSSLLSPCQGPRLLPKPACRGSTGTARRSSWLCLLSCGRQRCWLWNWRAWLTPSRWLVLARPWRWCWYFISVTTNQRGVLAMVCFPQQRPGSCSSTQEALQDVDDWELTELNPDWDMEEGDTSSPLPQVWLRSHLFLLLKVQCVKYSLVYNFHVGKSSTYSP